MHPTSFILNIRLKKYHPHDSVLQQAHKRKDDSLVLPDLVFGDRFFLF
jgi:hypothetical protein